MRVRVLCLLLVAFAVPALTAKPAAKPAAKHGAKPAAKAKSKPQAPVVIGLPGEESDDDAQMPTALPKGAPAQMPRARPVDPRAALSPPVGHLAPPPTTAVVSLTAPPTRADGAAFTCQAYGVVDVETGTILYGRNLTKALQPASLTKVLTTLLALEDLDAGKAKLSDVVTISEKAAHTPESGLWMVPGEHLTLRELLIGVMVRSANDAAYQVAEYLSHGDVAAFVQRMNRRARELGAINTHFINPHGLHVGLDGNPKAGEQHWTTGYDLLLICLENWRHPFYRELCLMDNEPVHWETVDPAKPHPPYRLIRNRNKLLHRYPECVGQKTGYTKQAGACLLSAALRDDRAVLAVTLHSPSAEDRWRENEALLRWGLDNFERREILRAGQVYQRVPVRHGRVDQVGAVVAAGVTAVVPKGGGEPTLSAELVKELNAPFTAGLPLGTLTISLPSGGARSVGLVVDQAVERRGWLLGPWGLVLLVGVCVVGVLAYGALAEIDRGHGPVFAAGGGGVDRRGPSDGQRPGGAGPRLES